LEAIIRSRGRAITTTAGNVAAIEWKPPALLAAAIAAGAVGLPRKHLIVFSHEREQVCSARLQSGRCGTLRLATRNVFLRIEQRTYEQRQRKGTAMEYEGFLNAHLPRLPGPDSQTVRRPRHSAA